MYHHSTHGVYEPTNITFGGAHIVVVWYVSSDHYLVPYLYHKSNSFVSHDDLILVLGGSPQESYVG